MVRLYGTTEDCAHRLLKRLSSSSVARRVDLVCFVYLVDLVHLVSFVQPNKRDKPNKPNNGLLTLADVFSSLLGWEERAPTEDR